MAQAGDGCSLQAGSALASSTPFPSSSSSSSGPTRDLQRGDFQVLQHLGEGSVGAVTKVRHTQTGEVYALKSIYKPRILEHNLGEQLLVEVGTQMGLAHQNLLRCFGFFEDVDHVFLLLEYAAGGDLHRLLKRAGALDSAIAGHITAQVIAGLRHLHDHGCIHRDLKAENVLLDGHFNAKIGDFGWCAKSSDSRTTFCGTPNMLAPEMILGKSYGKSVDIWALGVLLYEMLAGHSPFHKQGSILETCENIVKKGLSDALLANIPAAAHSLLVGLLRMDASQRMPLAEAAKHPWVVAQSGAWDPDKSAPPDGHPRRPDSPAAPAAGRGGAAAPSPATPAESQLLPSPRTFGAAVAVEPLLSLPHPAPPGGEGPARVAGGLVKAASPGEVPWTVRGLPKAKTKSPAPPPQLRAPPGAAAPENEKAGSLHPKQWHLVNQVLSLGFTEPQAVEAARRCSSVEAAVEWITASGPPG